MPHPRVHSASLPHDHLLSDHMSCPAPYPTQFRTSSGSGMLAVGFRLQRLRRDFRGRLLVASQSAAAAGHGRLQASNTLRYVKPGCRC